MNRQPATNSAHRPQPVVLFDGVCNLCNGFVQFVIERDPGASFKFASLQSTAAAALVKEHGGGASIAAAPESILLFEGPRFYSQSTAVLRAMRRLTFPWNLAYAFVIVPKPIRDALYAWIARNRYRWFGKRDVCMAPTPELRSRFLND